MTLKKLITLKNQKILCLDYNPKRATVTIGGDWRMQEAIWSIYLSCFFECDGEPEFYSVTRCKTRLQFKCGFKTYQQALGHLLDDGCILKEVDSFERLM